MTIVWTITGVKISDLIVSQRWSFIPTNELLALIGLDDNLVIRNTSLKLGITIIKPSTMTLTDVDMKYNGTFEFVVMVVVYRDDYDDHLSRYSYVDVLVLSKCL